MPQLAFSSLPATQHSFSSSAKLPSLACQTRVALPSLSLVISMLLGSGVAVAEPLDDRQTPRHLRLSPRAAVPSQPVWQPSTRPVLVLDFTGLNDTDSLGHAAQFADHLLPEAPVYTIGFRGVTPDGARKGYDVIVPYKTAEERIQAAERVFRFTSASARTILAFDVNESIVPQQLRFGAFDKTAGPADVAAEVAARWANQNPGGAILLRGHSDGTYVARRTFDRLGQLGVTPQVVILESPRQPHGQWIERHQQSPETKVISITSRADLPRVNLIGQGYHRTTKDNRINYHITDTYNPFKAHSAVTDMGAERSVWRADQHGTTKYEDVSLGELIKRDLSDIVVSTVPAVSSRPPPVTAPNGMPPTARDRVANLSEKHPPPPPPPPPPPGGDNASVSSGKLSLDTKGTPAVGGIDLAARAVKVDPSVEPIAGVVIDPQTGVVVLLAETGVRTAAEIDSGYFALGLWLAHTRQQAAMSLDPMDPANPQGKWLKAVYWPEQLSSHRAGQAAFDADFLLKQTAFCVRVRDGGKVVHWRSATGLKCIPDLMREVVGSDKPNWARMWIVPEEVILAGTDGAMRVSVRMGVHARRQIPDPNTRTGLRDVDTHDASPEARFAREFSNRYADLAQETREFAIDGLVKAIALARWVVDQGAAIDMDAVVGSLNRDRVATVGRVTAINAASRSETRTLQPRGETLVETRTIHLFGGVELSSKPVMKHATEMEQVRRVVAEKLATGAPLKFTVVIGDRTLQATRLPYSGHRRTSVPESGARARVPSVR